MARTFSQMAETVTESVKSQARRTGGRASTALITRHVKKALADDGSPNPPVRLVAPLVQAVRDNLDSDHTENHAAMDLNWDDR